MQGRITTSLMAAEILFCNLSSNVGWFLLHCEEPANKFLNKSRYIHTRKNNLVIC